MACRCGKTTPPMQSTPPPEQAPQPPVAQSFELQQDDGRVQTFGSRLEAEAARRRYRGQGQVRQRF